MSGIIVLIAGYINFASSEEVPLSLGGDWSHKGTYLGNMVGAQMFPTVTILEGLWYSQPNGCALLTVQSWGAVEYVKY
jgi:hypothetical protein